jgi:hypothetical protein
MSYIEQIRNFVRVGDHIKFKKASSDENFGLIVDASSLKVEVFLFHRMTSEMYRQHSLKPITATEYPMVYTSHMVELLASVEKIFVLWSDILGVVFVLPIDEVESGILHISGSKSIYFKRYRLHGDNKIRPCYPSLYFARYLVDPYTV